MAGAGYKLFSTGDVLSASDVNLYLQQQTVMVFASAAARTTALASVLAEGMVTYLKDTDVVEIYTGAAWVSLDDPNAIQNSIVDAKGDIITATADNTPARLAVGTNGQTLVADSSTATGLKWATPSSGSTFAGCQVYKGGGQTLTTSTWTILTFDTESFDTDAFHSTATNTGRMTIPAGKAGYYRADLNAMGYNWTNWNYRLLKNGSVVSQTIINNGMTNGTENITYCTWILNLAVSDYIEWQGYQNSGGNRDINPGTPFFLTYLGA